MEYFRNLVHWCIKFAESTYSFDVGGHTFIGQKDTTMSMTASALEIKHTALNGGSTNRKKNQIMRWKNAKKFTGAALYLPQLNSGVKTIMKWLSD